MLILLILQATSIEAATASTVAGTPLWRDVHVGMSPEQVAGSLKAMEGIKEVIVKRNKRNKFKDLQIKYTDIGVPIGDAKVAVDSKFEDEKLQEINLVSSACASVATERMKLMRDSLKEKYGHFALERVFDQNGVEYAQQAAFWNDQTRVRMSWEVHTPSYDYQYSSGRGVQGALSGLANMVSQTAYEAALKNCPDDAGSTVTTTINYSSQDTFLKTHAAYLKAREEKAKATKQAL